METAELIEAIDVYRFHGVDRFFDIMPLLYNPEATRSVVKKLAETVPEEATHIASMEARGFILGPLVAQELDLPFVAFRKPGKLPGEVAVSSAHDIEYRKGNQIEVQKGALKPGDRVLILDDVAATCNTAGAAAELVESMGAEVAGFSFLIYLSSLRNLNSGFMDRWGDKVKYLIDDRDIP